MGKVFEDDFMELQSQFISLCLEVSGKKVDEVYAYISIEKQSKMFNAFFTVNGNVVTLNKHPGNMMQSIDMMRFVQCKQESVQAKYL